MLPSINSSSSSSSSSHNIPVGVSAPQQHSHYFNNPNSFNEFNSPNGCYVAINGDALSSPKIFSPNI